MGEFENKDREEIFSKSIRAGKRTYFFDVKSTKSGDYYITATESKKRFTEDGKFVFEKHKIFLYKEDFHKFLDGINEAIDFVKREQPFDPEELAAKSAERKANNQYSNVNFEDLDK